MIITFSRSKQNVQLGLLFFVLSLSTLCAQTLSEYQRAQKYLSSRNEVYFSFPLSSNTDLNYLSGIVSLSSQVGDVMYAYANSREFDNFIKEGIEYTVEKFPSETDTTVSTYQGDLKDFRGESILNFDKYVELINSYEKQYPDLCKVYNIGKSIKGKDILILRITKGLQTDTNPKRPRFLVTNGVHGDELNGTKVSYGFINYLLKGYESRDAYVDKYLQGVDLYIGQHINPDGSFPSGNTTSGCGRANSAGVDLNRDYPAPKISREEYDAALSRMQVETKLIIEFEKIKQFNMAMDNHDDMKTMILPWSSVKSVPVNNEWLKRISQKFASAVGWKVMNAGKDSYIAVGTRMDWQPFYNHCWAFCPEYSNKGSNPQCSWNSFKSSYLMMLDEAMSGISGTVTDASGKGVDNVKVELSQSGKIWDKDGTESYTRSNGYYVRFGMEGTYDVVFTSGTKKKTVSGVKITNLQSTKLDVNLDGNTNIQQSVANLKQFFSVSNSVKGTEFTVQNTSLNPIDIKLIATNGKRIASWRVSAQSTEKTVIGTNALPLPRGCYVLNAQINGSVFSHKIVISH